MREVDLIIVMSLLQWLVMRYSIFNLEIIQAAVKMAKQERVFVSLDLASFEVHSLTTSDLSFVLMMKLLYCFKEVLKSSSHLDVLTDGSGF